VPPANDGRVRGVDESNAALQRRLEDRIRRDGPMTFAEYMEAALYDGAEGYYAHIPIGEDGDFVTSPHVSPVFGELVAAQVAELRRLLGDPGTFEVIELGAGDGTLAERVLGTLGSSVRYTGVERSADARTALRHKGIRTASSLAEIAPVEAGCLLA